MAANPVFSEAFRSLHALPTRNDLPTALNDESVAEEGHAMLALPVGPGIDVMDPVAVTDAIKALRQAVADLGAHYHRMANMVQPLVLLKDDLIQLPERTTELERRVTELSYRVPV